LIVLRSSDLDRADRFYRLLGINFVHERHGTGPEHLACELGSVVLEIYPVQAGATTTALRLGFQVVSMAAALAGVCEAGAQLLVPPKESPWGLRAVIRDPDGHRIELTEAVPSENLHAAEGSTP
jgi:predicted enzyme related to lactoylglutathione lyase